MRVTRRGFHQLLAGLFLGAGALVPTAAKERGMRKTVHHVDELAFYPKPSQDVVLRKEYVYFYSQRILQRWVEEGTVRGVPSKWILANGIEIKPTREFDEALVMVKYHQLNTPIPTEQGLSTAGMLASFMAEAIVELTWKERLEGLDLKTLMPFELEWRVKKNRGARPAYYWIEFAQTYLNEVPSADLEGSFRLGHLGRRLKESALG